MLRIVLIGATGLLLAGCGGSASSRGDTEVVAAFYPLAFVAAQIGGDAFTVVNLTPSGAEPHDLEISAGDARALLDAQLVLYVGGGFQPAVERAVAGADSAVDVLDLAGGGDRANEIRRRDPHVWLDPLAFRDIALAIGDRLGRREAATGLTTRLERLHRDLAAGLASCQRRIVVTSHAAFGHLAARYGLEQVPLQGMAPEAEPTPGDLERLVGAVRRSGATTVFVEPLVAPDVAETVAREAGVATATLNPLEGLTADELARGADYFSVMRDNLAALRKALGCR